MPVKGTCLLKDTQLKEALFDVIELNAYDRLKSGKGASLESIYGDLRKAGVEVDLPTVGEIYRAVLPRDDAAFTSDTDIDDFVLRTWNNAINNLIPAEESESDELTRGGQEQIGAQKPEAKVVEFLLNALYMDVAIDERTKSDMKVLQDALWKGMQRKLGKLSSTKPTQKTMEELIDESLAWEELGIRDLDGRLNSISDLFNSMRNELAKAGEQVRFLSSPDIIDRYNEYVRNLENATYNLMFTSKAALQIRNDALKKAGFGKNVNGRQVLDWNKLAAYTGSVADLRAHAHDAFTAAGYSQDVVERLKDTLEQEFYDLRADIVEKQQDQKDRFAKEGKKLVLEDAGLNQLLAGKTMAEWIKDQQIESIEDLEKKVNDALSKTNYIPAVKQRIQQRLTKFFSDNYAKVTEKEAKDAIKGIIGDKTIIEWTKQNGIQNQDELYEVLDKELQGRNISQKNKFLIKSEFDRILAIDQRAERELAGREKQREKEYSPKKSDLQRLVELYHLGIFKNSHDKLLYDILGVDDLQQEDIADLENLSSAASDLARRVVDVNGYNLTNDQFVARRLQYIQRHIQSVIDRNVKNKTKLSRILKHVANFMDLMLTGLLAGPVTMLQNMFSGIKSVLTGVRFNSTKEKVVKQGDQYFLQTAFGTTGPFATRKEAKANMIDLTGKTKQSAELYWAMINDVAKTGQSYGEEIGSFAARELFSNTLQWKWGKGLLGKGTTLKDKAKSVLFAYTLPARIGLLAFDSANKASLTNKTFYNMIYESLVKRGMGEIKDTSKMTDREKSEYLKGVRQRAAQFMNETLYGQSWEDAKSKARKILEQNNSLLDPKFRSKITNAEVITLANDIVKANLNVQGEIVGSDVLEAALKGSYHVAGLGLGHEPNNPLSRAIKDLRDRWKQQEDKFIKNKDWNNLVAHRMKNLLVNGFMIRFMGGATNWLVLRAKEGLGIGLFTGAHGLKLNGDIDYANKATLQHQMREREAARNDIARAFVGLSYTAMSYAIGAAIASGAGDDDDEREELARLEKKKQKTQRDYERIDELKQRSSIYAKIKSNSGNDRLFRAMAPDIMLVHYYSDSDGLLPGAIKYVDRTYFGNDKFSVSSKIKEAGVLYVQGDESAAIGSLTSIVGDRIQVPFWRASKEYYRVVTNAFTGDKIPPPKYQPATTWDEGLFGGGTLQDLGIYKRNSKITLVPGVGMKSYEKYKQLGIEKMSDLEDGWWNKRYKGEFILAADDRAKAKKFWNDYNKMTK